MITDKRKLRILYVLLIIIISTPLVMNIFMINSPDKPLKGVRHKVEIPKLSYSTFENHQFQLAASKYLNSNFGFSASLIRFYNQVEFSIFRRITNHNVLLGKDNYLFEPWYINAYYGKKFIGKPLIEDQVNKLVAIDSVIKSKGKTMIIALAPGKASVYPEKIPKYKRGATNENTNYQYYRKKLNETDLTVLDFNQWFLELKPFFKRHLFTKSGTHWSEDAVIHSMDTLFRLIEAVSGDSLNNIIIGEIEQSNNPLGTDNDLFLISNLLFDWGFGDYYYPKYEFEKHNKINKRLITISDSYFWNIYGKGLNHTFKDPQFWYYFKTVYQPRQKAKKIDKTNFILEIEQTDYLLIMASPSPINKFGWGFIDEYYDAVVGNYSKDKEIKRIISNILNNEDWTEKIRKKAIENNIDFDSMIRLDAEYIFDQKNKK